jgi:hypothetical protein
MCERFKEHIINKIIENRKSDKEDTVWIVYSQEGKYMETCLSDPSKKDFHTFHFLNCLRDHEWGKDCKFYCENVKIYRF